MSSEVIDIARPVIAAREVAVARDPVIDVARGIAILLVVLGHNRAISQSSPQFIDAVFLFHVPLFFFLSGYVFRRERFGIVATKLIRRLLVPCFAVALLVGVIKSVTRDESLVQTLIGIGWATGQTLPWSHLWFLPTLFLALIVTQVLGYVCDRQPSRWFAGVLAATALAAISLPSMASVSNYAFADPVGMPWSLDLLAPCLVFVLLGQLLQVSAWLWQRVRSVAVAVVATLMFAWAASLATVDLNLRIFSPALPALCAALSGCVLALNVAAWISRAPSMGRTCAFIGRHTLPIFLLHVSIQKALLQLDVVQRVFADYWWIAGLLTAALAIAASVMVERYLIARINWLRYLFLPGRGE